ncbi:MAG: hypothetical protein ACLFU0_10300 [Alphaproteobacteria bacterium]
MGRAGLTISAPKCKIVLVPHRVMQQAARRPDGFLDPRGGGTRHKCRGKAGAPSVERWSSADLADRRGDLRRNDTEPRLWFRALHHLIQTRQKISSTALARRRGVMQTTALKIEHKLEPVVLERDGAKRACGLELADADIGGERQGGQRGRGAAGKTPFVTAGATTPAGRPARESPAHALAPARTGRGSCVIRTARGERRAVTKARLASASPSAAALMAEPG